MRAPKRDLYGSINVSISGFVMGVLRWGEPWGWLFGFRVVCWDLGFRAWELQVFLRHCRFRIRFLGFRF